ncbi:LacI family DNA-binding transcriptional regulator [Blastococcus deserti]|uniref:LacI family DNA-binding transcriptional regulator n=1 Tax=Blastococcus deserti TaxID=2259033 RepID=A0ABW4XEN6_9ACTN
MATSSPGERVSLKHVAARAGVSVKTVSNVVNGYQHVTAETRARVQQAIDELHYRPNLAARNLRRGRSNVIALALPELDLPYFAELARSVIKAAEEVGWTVLIDQTDGLVEREQLVLDGIRGRLIDGLIFSPITLGAADLERRRDTTPLVLLGERVYDGPADHVSIDNLAAAQVATGHLVELGRRRIAAIGDQPRPTSQTAHLRLRGHLQALARAGLPAPPELVCPVERYHRADGAAAMHRLLDLPEPPDAVFCFNDLLALGALRALHERGVRVPDDVAVVGWDDVEDGRYSTPTLTTISPDKQQIASLAVEFLATQLESMQLESKQLESEQLESEGRGVPREVTADFGLAVRESTVGARAG